MAQSEVPTGEFIEIDVMDYEFPYKIDLVFAFASLLHLPKESIKEVLEKISHSLNVGGVMFISLKRREEYSTAEELDGEVGRRFYYYNREVFVDILPNNLKEVFYDEQELKEPWFTMILQKV